MACPFAFGAGAIACVIREARAGEAAESNIARRGLAAGATGTGEGDATAGAAAGGSAIATGAIAEPGGLCSASPRTACRFGVAAGATTGATRNVRTARAACLAGAGATIARRGPANAATGAEKGGAKAGFAIGGGEIAAGAMAGCTGGVSASLTVPVGGDTAVGRTARTGRRRAGLAAVSLSDRDLVSRGQGMSPKWPAAANTAPPAKSRPKAASTVDQRNAAAGRWLKRTARRSRCLILSRSASVSSSSGSAARTRDASGPRRRSADESVVLLSAYMRCCPRTTGQRKAELARGAPSPRRRCA